MQEKLRGKLQERSAPRYDGKDEEKLTFVKDAAAAAGSPGRASGRTDVQNVSKDGDGRSTLLRPDCGLT